MAILVNGPFSKKRLVDYVAKATQDTTQRNGKRILYAVSCYFVNIRLTFSRVNSSRKV